MTGACDDNLLCVARLMPSGRFDESFGLGGGKIKVQLAETLLLSSVKAVAIQQDRKVLVSSRCASNSSLDLYEICVVRLLINGSVDPTFGSQDTPGWFRSNLGGVRGGSYMPLDSRQRILLATTCSGASQPTFCSLRLTPEGIADSPYGSAAHPAAAMGSTLPSNSIASAARLQIGDDLVVAGWCGDSARPGHRRFCVARFVSRGVPDITFGASGSDYVTTYVRGNDDFAQTVSIQVDGSIVVAGGCLRPANSASARGLDFCAARFVGRPYAAQACTLNIDANFVVAPFSDAVLIIRYLLGYRGDALTVGALGQNPTRTGQALETYLGSLNLDADGDGQALAMTDGLLILRAMLGLTGTALTQGATNTAHPDVRNAQRILTWIESTHGVACLP